MCSCFRFSRWKLQMVKEMSLDWNPWSLRKHNHVFVKISVSFLLMGLAFRLFFSDSIGFSSVPETPLLEKTETPEIPVKILLPPPSPSPSPSPPPPLPPPTPEIEEHKPSKEKCDIFTGDWIPNPSGPIYTNETCNVIEQHQNCMTNGRPDSGYLYWRWNPRDCELPPFNPERFFELMRHKSWAFIGDSISRNHVQSLLCILSKVDKAVQVYHDREYKSKRWHFPSYNFTLSVIWSPFLVQAITFEDNNGVSKSDIELYLDELDKKWTDQYLSFDYVVIAGGKWFLKTAIYYENETIVGCHYCPGKNLTELGFDYAYRKVLQLVLNFFVTSNHKGSVLFRTSTPDHFENGEWFSGGTCSRTLPFKEGEINMSDVDVVFRNIELEEYEKAVAALGSKEDLKLMLMDTTRLSLLRPDGHPGPYRHPHPFASVKNSKVQNDCLHWCLPGPIDAWNDLVMELVVNS
ncbi:protein trichome birefringence-like 25 [Macadamia integrifolia]|uniref:protein trichome birefringence-like 25 n=1 Tax=Macadamia integrifolia TaxID=60698 RepID=UPI001C4F3812|nr:protein trichome birefringence-like 25 [Macadamia integrifolia]